MGSQYNSQRTMEQEEEEVAKRPPYRDAVPLVPVDKLRRPAPPSARGSDAPVPLVMYFNGTFAPIHCGHVNTLCDAKRFLEEQGHEVLGGYISPCWAGYCNGKLLQDAVSTRHRLNMCSLAASKFDWLMVDAQQALSGRYPDLYEILEKFYNTLCEVEFLEKGTFKLAWINGVDNAHPGPMSFDFVVPVCVANRARGAEERLAWLQEEYDAFKGKRTCYMFEQPPVNISSTAIRKAIKNGEAIRAFYDENTYQVAEYIEEHGLWEPIVDQDLEQSTSLLDFISSLFHHHKKEAKRHPPAEDYDVGETQRKTDESEPLLEKEVDTDFYRESDAAARKARRREHRATVYEGFVPDKPPQLLPSNLAAMLQFAGVACGNIRSFKVERFGQGRGWRSVLVRIHDIVYASKSDEMYAPKTVIAKFARGMRVQEGSESKVEALFYRHLAHRMGAVRVPQHYFAHYEGDRGIILMEELTQCQAFEFQQPVPTEYFMHAVDSLAELHAEWWNHPVLEEHWLNNTNLRDFAQERFAHLMEVASEELDQHMGKDIVATCRKWGDSLGQTMEDLSASFSTLIHGDLWINNSLFANDKPCSCFGENMFALVDWQTCCKGNGLIDVSLLLLTLLAAEETEEKVLRRYHNTLQRYGVPAERYTWERCLRDWLWAKKVTFCITFPLSSRWVMLRTADPDMFMTPEDRELAKKTVAMAEYFYGVLQTLLRADKQGLL